MPIYKTESAACTAQDFSQRGPNGGEIASLPVVAAGNVNLADGSIDVVVARLKLSTEEIDVLAALLSDPERQRAKRFVFDRDRNRFIVARARLRELLACRLGMAPQAIELQHGTHGKPALAPGSSSRELRFNVSHSEDVAVYAFVSGREIGIDVEAVRVIRDADDLAARFFSRRENEAYRALDRGDKPLGFFNCWTRKEAFVKALGNGLSYPLDSFDVSLAPGEPATILRVENIPGDECGWNLSSFSPGPGFVAAVVTKNPGH
jgi:4'-phosphopantetheinyl transferase